MKQKNTFNFSLIIILFVFTIFSKNVYSQCIIPPPYSGVVTGVSFTGMLLPSFIQSLNVSSDSAYIVVSTIDGITVGSTCVSLSCLDSQGQTSLTIWGDDTFTIPIDGAVDGAILNVQLVDGMYLRDLSVTYMGGVVDLVFQTNGIAIFSSAVVESSCYYDESVGCTDSSACNYNSDATSDDGSCLYINNSCDVCVNGLVIDYDEDNDDVCDVDEIAGCMDESACNFNPLATDPPINVNIGADTLYIYTDSNFVDNNWVMTDSVEFEPINPMDCTYEDTDNDGVCDIFEIVGCNDPYACNYDATPTTDPDNSLCNYSTDLDECATCSGEQDGTGTIIDRDFDNDGVCDDDEIVGCQNTLACNFNLAATDSDYCIIPVGCETCSGETDGTGIVVDNDSDDDGVCNDDEVLGCTDTLACTYSELATEEDYSCLYFDSCGECGGNDNCAVFIEDNIQITIDETLVEDIVALETFENNFEDLMETQLGLPEGCVEVIEIIFLYRGEVEIEVVYTITLTEEEIEATDLDPNLQPEDIINQINQEINEIVTEEQLFNNIEFIEGCTNSNACNFDVEANIEVVCIIPVDCETCSGETDGSGYIIYNDIDDDGVCDFDEITGCTDYLACNYDATPTTDTDNSLCNYSTDLDECATCSSEQDGTGTIVDNDLDDDGVCNQDEISGCKDNFACNYDALFTTDQDNSLCIFASGCETCSGASDGSGYIIYNDLDDDGVCNSDEIIGCTDALACNYDANPTTDVDNSLCIYSADIDACASCSGASDGSGYIIENDSDNDGICDQDEIEGCITMSACNYNDIATEDDGSCIYPESQYNCDGECLLDFDNDGVCDPFEILGCTDNAYLEYDSLATQNNGSCVTLIVLGCLDDSYLEYNIDANVSDSSLCITLIVLGCMDSLACNFNSTANISDDSCVIVDGICDTCEDGGIVDNDLDDDGVCNSDEIIGCTDALACNYDSTPTTDTDNSLCNYSMDLDECATCSGETDGTGTIVDNDLDDDGVCNSDEIIGCTDALACNYDATPTTDTDNSLCNYLTDLDECATCSGETDGTGTIIDNDFDDDGVCDEVDYDDGIGVNELVNVPINLYPNPSNDFINIDFESNLSNVSIEILNALGEVIIVESSADISSKHTMQMSVQNLPSGLYLLRVKSDYQLHRLNWIKN